MKKPNKAGTFLPEQCLPWWGGFEIVGGVVEKTSFGATRLTPSFRIVSVRFGSASEWLVGIGKMLGVIGGVVASVVIFSDGIHEYSEGHHALSFAHITLAWLSFISALLLLTSWAVLGFIVGILIGLILLMISIFKNNKVQDWLESARFFGDGEAKPFRSPVDQLRALSLIGAE